MAYDMTSPAESIRSRTSWANDMATEQRKRTVSFDTWSCHLTLSMVRRQRDWNTFVRVHCTWDRPVQTASCHQVWQGVVAWWLRHGWTRALRGWRCWDTKYLVQHVDAWCRNAVQHAPCSVPRPWLHDVCEAIDSILSIYAIGTVIADTETKLLNGFAWLIYFNVVKTEQLETETEARDTRLETQDWDRGSILRPRLKASRPRPRLWNLSLKHSENRKSSLSTTTPPTFGEKSLWTLVHKRKKVIEVHWPTQVDIFRDTIFRPLGGATPSDFYTR